jgi:hypothetical protein
MKNTMKKTALHILIGSILFSLLSGMVVSIIGLVLGWKTLLQFSNGFFTAGSLMLAIGFLSGVGMRNQIGNSTQASSQPEVNSEEHGFRLWVRDILRGNNILVFLGISGLLLFGLAGLVEKLF